MNWREWLEQLSDFGSTSMEQTGLPVFLLALGASLGSSFLISHLYVVFRGDRSTGSQIHRAFPLLGLSITAIFITIQFSLPLSLGLLGALSIVRFRTPIKEPEEISFIMLVAASALCCATFNLLFLAVILSMAVLAMFLVRRMSRASASLGTSGVLVISLPEEEHRRLGGDMLAFLARELPEGGLDSVSEESGRTSISYRFKGLAAQRVPDVQRGLRSVASGARSSLYMDSGMAA